ncbi:6-carboxytetrahydropterin synthase [Rhizobium beringeri]
MITREIGIDAAHRIPHHESKCHNLHGHRYKIAATCVGPLCGDGEQTGMVLDFRFLEGRNDGRDRCLLRSWHDDLGRRSLIGSFLPENASEAKAAAVLRKYRDEVTHAGQKLIEGPFGKTLCWRACQLRRTSRSIGSIGWHPALGSEAITAHISCE